MKKLIVKILMYFLSEEIQKRVEKKVEDQLYDLENDVEKHDDRLDDLEDSREFANRVEEVIEGYDFADIIKGELDSIDLFEHVNEVELVDFIRTAIKNRRKALQKAKE